MGAGPGVIIGIRASKFLTYPVNAVFARRYGLWMPSLDGLAFLGCGACVAAGWMLAS
jgi:membrane protein YqaA with SNARE-associated domain